MHKIKNMLMKELKKYEEKAQLSAGDLEVLHKLTDTVKNIDKIEMLEGEGGYSEDGMSYDGGASYRGRGSYDEGYSERRRRDSRGRYARDGGGGSNDGGSYDGGGSNRGYSRGSAKEHMTRKMEELLNMAESEAERKAIEQCLDKLESM